MTRENTTAAEGGDRLADPLREALYEFAASLLNNPIDVPGTAWCEDALARSEALIAGIAQDAAGLSEPNGPEAALRDADASSDAGAAAVRAFADFSREAKKRPLAKTQQALAVERCVLFRATKRERGPRPPYESSYRPGASAPAVQSELQRFFGAYGSGVAAGAHERPDYLGIECAFMAALIGATAAARERYLRSGEEADRQELRRGEEAQGQFLAQHLAPWVGAYCDEALPFATSPFFRGFLLLLKDFMARERAQAGI